MKIERERGIWDIISPDGGRMYVAHRTVGLVAINHLHDDRECRSIRHALAVNPARIPVELNMKLGALFEKNIRNQGEDFGGIFPESSTVYVRHPYKK